MTRSYTGQILQLAEIPEYVFSHPGERTEVAKTIRNALYELCYGLKGTAINAYESACSIEGGDKEWKETGTLEGVVSENGKNSTLRRATAFT